MNQIILRTPALKEGRLALIFWIFACVHLLAWTLLPFIVRFTLPMDSIEGYVWGQQLEWGYDKNPFLNGWLTALAVKIGGNSGWMIYFFSQLSVVLCFWAIWQLGKKILPPIYALLGVLLLEGVQYYNFHAIDFNDNTLELGLWALLILCFYQALRSPSPRSRFISWLACGIFAGLSMMTKYYAIVLLAPMTLFLFLFRENYHCFKTKGFYFALVIFIFISTPHFLWLFSHDFVTVNYAFDRVGSKPTLWNHLSYPWQFFYEQLEALLPVFLLTLTLFMPKKPFALAPRFSSTLFDKTFLIVIGLGPFLFTIFLSLLAGLKLRAGWGEPLFSLVGLLLMAYLQPFITQRKFYSFICLLTVLFILALTAYGLTFRQAKDPSSANFPGALLADRLSTRWHETYHQPLRYVAGSRWLSGNLAFYSVDHPHVYLNWNKRFSPWIDEADLKQKGAIFIWEKNELPPEDLTKRFPELGKIQTLALLWLRNKNLPPIEVKVAFLPPTASAAHGLVQPLI